MVWHPGSLSYSLLCSCCSPRLASPHPPLPWGAGLALSLHLHGAPPVNSASDLQGELNVTKLYCLILYLYRSSGSHLSTAPSTPLQPKAIDIGGLTLTGSAASTLRAGRSTLPVSVQANFAANYNSSLSYFLRFNVS